MMRTWAAALALVLAFTSANHLVCEWTCAAATRTPAPTTCPHGPDASADFSVGAGHGCSHDAAVTLVAPAKSGKLDRLTPIQTPGPDDVVDPIARSTKSVGTSTPPGPPLMVRPVSILRI